MAALAVLAFAPTVPAAAAGWPVPVVASGPGAARATAIPSAPANPVATCSLVSLQITVSWSAVPHASSYTVYQSTSGSSGAYSPVATVGGTSWTSGVLLLGTYWYRVTATVGTTWTSAPSAATAGHAITLILCT